MKKKTHKEFLSQLQETNPKVKVLSQYVNASTKVELECLVCHHIWSATPSALLRGSGCPKCANNIRKTTEQFIDEMKCYNPYIEIIGDYKNAHTPIEVRCKICGNEWSIKPNRLLSGGQCLNCVKPHTSFMEQFILIAFQELLGKENVISRDTSAIGMELDIYIPKYELAIEIGTWLYHEKKANDRDLLKRIECTNNGIRLITIYDTFPKNTPSPFDKDCFVYSGFLNENGYKRITDLVVKIANSIGITDCAIDSLAIASKAYEACHYNSHEAFLNNLSKIAPSIEVLEQYKGTNIPILVNDTKCSHPSWKARPYTLLNGIGCPLCGRETARKTRTKSCKQFTKELRKISPNISVIGDYKTVTDRIEVQCEICGKTWTPLAYSLLQGKGCPHCSAIEGAKKRTNKLAVKTTELFKEKMSAINSNILILGEYVNNKTKIRAQCLKCGYEWDVVPSSLLNGHGCPKCAIKERSNTRRRRTDNEK